MKFYNQSKGKILKKCPVDSRGKVLLSIFWQGAIKLIGRYHRAFMALFSISKSSQTKMRNLSTI